MTKYRNSNAPTSTSTYNRESIESPTENIYQALSIISKRSNQISSEIKEELTSKLQEFASNTDNLEEIFENREQIEISKHYEGLPKATAIAAQELLDDKIYVRHTEGEEK